VNTITESLDGVVDEATNYRLDDRGTESQQRQENFPLFQITDTGPENHTAYVVGIGVLSPG
jgi:hypothetical protein